VFAVRKLSNGSLVAVYMLDWVLEIWMLASAFWTYPLDFWKLAFHVFEFRALVRGSILDSEV
jgi:hypothetical protein